MERIGRLDRLAKAGFAARGVLYLLLGYFAVVSGSGEDATSILRRIEDAPGGAILLVAMSIGLAGYGLFRLFSAWTNLDHKKQDLRGRTERAGQALSGLLHLGLAILAIRTAFAIGGGGGGPSGAEWLQRSGGGSWLLILVGSLIIVAGLGNLLEAWAAKFRRLIGIGAPGWIVPAGRFGYAARGAVFLVIGWQLIRLAAGGSADQPGTESALDELRNRAWLFYSVAAGLGVFGAFNLVLAAVARIPKADVLATLKQGASGRTA